MKAEGNCPQETEYRKVKHPNSVVQADLGKLTQLIWPVRGFKTPKSAYATIKVLAVMHALRKGKAGIFNFTNDIFGEARIVERTFGIVLCSLAEAMGMLENRLTALN